MKKRIRTFSTVRLKLIEAQQEMILLRLSLQETFASEIGAVRSLLVRYPFLSVSFAFVAGVFFGGLLQARVSQFAVLALLGGFPLAIVYGHSQGVPTIFSIGFVIALDSFVSYSLLKLMKALSEYPRIEPYLSRIRVRYSDSSRLFTTYSGRLGAEGALAVCTFLIGWWIATVIAYLMDLDTRTAMFSIFSGLMAGGLLSWALYEGFVRLIPDPATVIVIFLVIFIVAGFVVGRLFRRIGED